VPRFAAVKAEIAFTANIEAEFSVPENIEYSFGCIHDNNQQFRNYQKKMSFHYSEKVKNF